MAIQCRQCESQLEDGAVVCVLCGAAVNETTSLPLPFSPPAPMFSSTDSDLVGIGGWLILPAIGLAVSPFSFAYGIYVDLRFLVSSQYQAGLAARPGLAGVLMFEAVNNSMLFLATILLNILFYRKKRAFPGYMMAYLGGQFLLGLADQLMAMRLTPHTDWTQVMRGLVGCAIWIPYFLQSRRVEVTFVN